MSNRSRIYLPLLVLLIGAAAAVALYRMRPQVARQETPVSPRLVRVVEARSRDLHLIVHSQGTVSPRTESVLVAQVSGRVEAVSEQFADGGFFERDDVLLRIDRRDYELAVERAEALVAQARVRLDMERAEADVALQEWNDLGRGEPTALTRREPQLREAEATLQSARAALERARLDLERTEVRAPFDGRIRAKRVDLGQYVAPGTPLAETYSTDAAEVRLPVPKDDLAFLDLDLGDGDPGAAGPPVTLRTDLYGAEAVWEARVVRADGAFDPRTRMLDLFARVDDPFRRGNGSEGPPLPMGLFVDAEIRGRVARDVIVLPRAALRDGDQVLVADEEGRLRFRPVEVMRKVRDEVILRAGVLDGEMVCISPLETVVDGMRVRTIRVPDDSVTAPRIEEGP